VPDFQTGQAISVDYLAETVFNTLPAATGSRRFRLTGGGLVPGSDVIESAEFRGDGQTSLPRLGMKAVTGGYAGELSVGTYDPLFEALLRGTWTTEVAPASNTLLPATTMVNRSFSFEEYRSVINESLRYTGCRISSCRFSLPANAAATVDFGILGTNYTRATGKYFTTPTTTATSNLVAVDAVVLYNSLAFVSMTSADFTVDLRAANQAVIGSRLTPDIFTSAMRISGSVSAVRSDASLLTQYFAETAVPLQFTITDPAAAISYIILLPSIRFTGLTPGLGTDGPEIVTLPFSAGYDATTGGMIKITRDLTA